MKRTLVLLTCFALWGEGNRAPAQNITRIPVQFAGGHETDARDHGRPVKLISAGLGVTPEVFREAFSRVRPARAGTEPEREQVRANKAVLLGALGKYGVSNEKLDAVSDYYRYVPGRGELWRTKSAAANALVQDGKITGFEIIDGGSGYSSPPTVSIPGFKQVSVDVKLSFGTNLKTNGTVSGLSLKEKAER